MLCAIKAAIRSFLLPALAGVLLTLAARAQVPDTVPVPSVTGPVPVTEDSYPQAAAGRMQTVVDLASLDYVEEEYFISGRANVYDWLDGGSLRVKTADAPYTTRILVRRPRDPEQASGSVVVELVNNARDYDWPFIWPLSWRHFTERGDIWVGVTHSPGAVAALKQFDGQRYAEVSFANPTPGAMCPDGSPMEESEEGLRWDAISQVGALLKSGAGDWPLADFQVDRVYATTHYGELSTYVNAVHAHANMPDGSPVYDGYLIKSNDYPVRINQCASAPGADDPRRIARDTGVPVIRMIAQGDVLSTYPFRREDSDAPGDRYRLYEVAGAPHMDTIYYRHMPVRADQAAAGQTPYHWNWPLPYRCEPDIRLMDFPVMRHAVNAAFANLDRWVREGTSPPRAERIELDTAGDAPRFITDRWGNVQGGVRSPYLDVPVATYHAKAQGPAVCGNLGWKEAFTWQGLRDLYGSPTGYSQRIDVSVESLVEARWLTPADAERIRNSVIFPPVGNNQVDY